MGKSPQTVRRMIKKGELDAQRIKTPQGFHYVVRRDAVGVPKAKRHVVMEEIPAATEEIVQKSVAVEAPIQMLDNLYVQNPPAPLVEATETVLTNQTEILTSRNGLEVHKQADSEGLDKSVAENVELRAESQVESQPALQDNSQAELRAECCAELRAELQSVNDMHHREKLGLFKIVDSLQAELDRERRKPRSLMAYFMEWLLS